MRVLVVSVHVIWMIIFVFALRKNTFLEDIIINISGFLSGSIGTSEMIVLETNMIIWDL